jgi:hypothetical protein
MEEVPWRVIWPGFDGEAAGAPPMEISDSSQFTVMPRGTQLMHPMPDRALGSYSASWVRSLGTWLQACDAAQKF